MTAEKRTIVLASRNRDKIREMSELCAGLPFDVKSTADYPGLPDVIEDGTTAVGNASRKAIVTAAFTGEIAVADDTTFQIRALNALPDIFAARFAGPDATYADNAALAVEMLRDVPDDQRQARFETAMVWVDPCPGGPASADRQAPRPATQRWLVNPFARAIHVYDQAQEAGFWNRLSDHQEVWRQYRTAREAMPAVPGVDLRKSREILDRLLAPVESGEAAAVGEGMMQLPDPRIWAVSGPHETEAATLVTPAGLPADAPGRAVNEPVWYEIAAEGRLLGELTRQPLGTKGFGYDPVFRVADDHRTLAEYEPHEKNAISHRGRAMRRLMRAVCAAYGL